MSDSIKQRTIIGTLWSAAQKFGTVIISFISNLILAHMLTPNDFGCIAMLAIFLVIADTFVDSGLGSAIIQKRELTNFDLSTVFYFNIILSIFLYLILFFSAPLISEFYRINLLRNVLRVEGLILILNSLSIVQTALLRKELRFKELATAILISNLVAVIIAVILAYKGFGVWALVIQQLLVSFTRMIILWMLSKWKPEFMFSKQSFHQLFRFGSYIFLSNLINNVGNNMEGLIIGRWFNAGILGFFSQARKLEDVVSKSISGVLDQVIYPALSKKQDDKESMVNIMKTMIKLISFVTFPIMILLAITGKLIIPICYGPQWNASAPMFQILCLAGLAVCLQGINYHAIAAIGQSKVLFKWTVIKRIVALALLFIGLYWGMRGFLIGFVIGTYLTLIINGYLVQIHLKYSLRDQFFDILPIIFVTVISASMCLIIKYVLPKGNDIIALLILSIVFGATYWMISRLVKLQAYEEMVNIVKALFKKNFSVI